MRIIVIPCALACTVLLVEGLRLCAGPGFAPSLRSGPGESMRIVDLRLQLPPREGGVRLHARLAKPGHESIGPFSLGIPTFLELRQITATAESAVGGAHDFRADRGRWDGDGLLLEGPVRCRGRDVTFAADRVTISPTGTVRIGR